eukprot:11839699-Heterocapsa_arctica.AAC.1
MAARLGSANALTENEREKIIEEMTKEMQVRGSVYSWYERQFWQLRFAAANMTGRIRLDLQHAALKSSVMQDKLTAPDRRTVPEGTKAEHAKEATYIYNCEIYTRLE